MQTNTTDRIKQEVDKGLEKLTTLRDEVRVKLHLASLDAKKEWDDKLAPKVLEVEQLTKSITESSRSTLHDVIAKMEDFLARIHPKKSDDDKPPHSVH
jgi:hypothetical protein